MSALLITARAILGLLHPLTGDRAQGNLTVKATGGNVTLPKYSYAIPVRTPPGGGPALLDPDSALKTTSAVTVTAAGVSVPVRSLLGGARHNLAPGTQVKWVPEIQGVEKLSVVAAGGLIGATSPADGTTHLKAVTYYERIGPGSVALDLFAARAGQFPAAVLEWSSSVPRPDSRRARGKRLFDDRWTLSLIVSRSESAFARSEQGLELIDDVADIITDRRDAGDGQIFTGTSGILISGIQRVSIAPTSFVYAISFTTTRTVVRKEWRTFTAWLKARIDLDTQTGDVRGELPLVDNNLVTMP